MYFKNIFFEKDLNKTFTLGLFVGIFLEKEAIIYDLLVISNELIRMRNV